jgi:hypothetical protein
VSIKKSAILFGKTIPKRVSDKLEKKTTDIIDNLKRADKNN